MNIVDLYRILISVGAIQGIVLGVILFKANNERKKANRFLSYLLFFFSYRLLIELFSSYGLIGFTSWTYHIALDYNWVYGSLIFFYAKAYIDPDFKLLKKDWIHLLPVSIEFIISNYVRSLNFYWDGTTESIGDFGTSVYIFWMHWPSQFVIFSLIIIFYVLKSLEHINIYSDESRKPVQKEEISWLKTLLRIYLSFAFITIIIVLIDFFFFDFAFNQYYRVPLYSVLGLLTYWLGIQGNLKKDLPYLTEADKGNPILFEKHSLAIQKLEASMNTDKLYLNPDLNLRELAEHIQLQPHQLTQVLNRSIQKSFSDYVNSYRVDELKRLINSEDFKNKSILGLAYDSGFNSKASLNRIVKKIT